MLECRPVHLLESWLAAHAGCSQSRHSIGAPDGKHERRWCRNLSLTLVHTNDDIGGRPGAVTTVQSTEGSHIALPVRSIPQPERDFVDVL